jgi:hypothetical protein
MIYHRSRMGGTSPVCRRYRRLTDTLIPQESAKMAVAPVRVQVIEEAMPFGDVPLAPSAATGRSEVELARAIAGLAEPAPALVGIAGLMRRTSRPNAPADANKRAA